MAFSFIKSLV